MQPTQPPTYEGRPLAHPDEPVVDQGLQFDITTLMKRRGLLALLGGSLGAVSLAACSATPSATPTSGTPTTATSTDPDTASALTEIPDETAGPYPGDGSNGADVLEQSGVVRSDIRSSFGSSTTTATGVPMTLELEIIDMASGNVPFAGVAVYVWHATDGGEYSMYSSGLENENFLRGVQIADANGKVTFTSVFPGCYDGRWPHIHFEVYPDEASIVDSTNAISTSQVALPEDTCRLVYETSGYPSSTANLDKLTLATDNVFGDDGGASQLGTATGDVNSGFTVSLRVGVDSATQPTGGSMPGQGQPPGDGGGRPPGGRP